MAEYFGAKAEDSISRFLSSQTSIEKNKIFEEEIRLVFEELIHKVIFVYKFQNIDDVNTMKAECMTHLYEMLPKFDPARGTKAFSYFNVITRNWFINRSKDAKKREKSESDLPAGIDYERFRTTQPSSTDHFEGELLSKEFWISFYKEMASWKHVQMRPQEREVLDKVIFLFQNSELMSIHNSKAVNIYLKELTNLSSKQITSSLKRLRELYIEYKNRYHNGQYGEQKPPQ